MLQLMTECTILAYNYDSILQKEEYTARLCLWQETCPHSCFPFEESKPDHIWDSHNCKSNDKLDNAQEIWSSWITIFSIPCCEGFLPSSYGDSRFMTYGIEAISKKSKEQKYIK